MAGCTPFLLGFLLSSSFFLFFAAGSRPTPGASLNKDLSIAQINRRSEAKEDQGFLASTADEHHVTQILKRDGEGGEHVILGRMAIQFEQDYADPAPNIDPGSFPPPPHLSSP